MKPDNSELMDLIDMDMGEIVIKARSVTKDDKVIGMRYVIFTPNPLEYLVDKSKDGKTGLIKVDEYVQGDQDIGVQRGT